MTQESKPARKTLSPTWNERFQFKVRPSSTLLVSVWNFRKLGKNSKSGFMGRCAPAQGRTIAWALFGCSVGLAQIARIGHDKPLVQVRGI